jgi:hypothetical protein
VGWHTLPHRSLTGSASLPLFSVLLLIISILGLEGVKRVHLAVLSAYQMTNASRYVILMSTSAFTAADSLISPRSVLFSLQCRSGYGVDGRGSCMLCEANCLDCNADRKVCVACNPGFCLTQARTCIQCVTGR